VPAKFATEDNSTQEENLAKDSCWGTEVYTEHYQIHYDMLEASYNLNDVVNVFAGGLPDE